MQSQPMHADAKNADEVCPLPESAEAQIADGLKRLYGQMLAEPMPDKFAGLLKQLAESDRKREEGS